jgi:hypothetical protein
MNRFWKYQIRFRLARWMIHAGLWIWPPGTAKNEVLELLRAWSEKVYETNAATRAALEPCT